MNNTLQSIIDENNKMILEIKDLKKQISELNIMKLQHENLRECFSKIINEVLGEDYYNNGSDVYSCDTLASQDIIKLFKKEKKGRKKNGTAKSKSIC